MAANAKPPTDPDADRLLDEYGAYTGSRRHIVKCTEQRCHFSSIANDHAGARRALAEHRRFVHKPR